MVWLTMVCFKSRLWFVNRVWFQVDGGDLFVCVWRGGGAFGGLTTN